MTLTVLEKFIFPFGHVAILSNITRAQLTAPELAGLTDVFSPDRTITRDELDIWATLGGTQLKNDADRAYSNSSISGVLR
jgi:hypothetical protein